MTTILITYLIGLIFCPILLILLNKMFKGSMQIGKEHTENSNISAAIICSFFWPIGIICMFILLLFYFINQA